MLVVTAVVAALVVLVVLIHLFVLQGLTAILERVHALTRLRMAIVILGAVLGHLVEIEMFALGTAALENTGRYGEIRGNLEEGSRNHFYYSAVTYTTLGYGDLTPTGPLRILAAVEALIGMLLITWTASFTFLTMQKFWIKE